ncbi:Rho GTPase-activating protein gacU [Tanacetum coccineum]
MLSFPETLSSSVKLLIDRFVRLKLDRKENDCNLVAQLTTKIKHLASVLHKKDKHSRKGLQAMVQKRKKLLKYLRRTDWDSYCFCLSELGLRDSADYKA